MWYDQRRGGVKAPFVQDFMICQENQWEIRMERCGRAGIGWNSPAEH